MLETKQSLLLGGLHDEYNNYNQLQNQIAKTQSEIAYLEKEVKLFQDHLALLRGQERMLLNQNTLELNLYNEVKYFIAPLEGVISDIFYATNEICYKKEEMITIHQLNNATINTYFDPTEINHLKEGDIVKVDFPDNTIREGIISKFYVSTYAVPSEFQKKYEPTERNIVAEVIPLNREDASTWKQFYKMEVKVRKSRYDLGQLLKI